MNIVEFYLYAWVPAYVVLYALAGMIVVETILLIVLALMRGGR